MMPLGSHSVGGRSSNLSHLAPPFTIDKPYHNPHNSNPPLNFTEPPYGPRFDRPRPVWSPSSFIENNSRNGDFSSPGSQPNNSSLSDPLNPVGSGGYDGSPYGRHSNSVPTSLVDAKPYYPPYEPGYDLLSNFGSGKLSRSSQVDPECSRVWNGMSNAEQRASLDLLGGSFGSRDYKSPVSSAAQKCIKKVGSLESYVESKNCFGGFGGQNNFESRSMEDGKSAKEPNPGTATGSCIRKPAMGSTSAGNKNRDIQDQFFQAPPISKYFGRYESPLDSQDKEANYTDSYFLDSASTMRSSPENPIRLTFGGFPSPQDAALSITLNSVNNEDKIETPFDFLPYHPFGLNCQLRIDDNIKKKNGNDDSYDQLLKSKSDTAVTFFSKEISSDGPEIQNPAVDSPCWKGALATRLSPVEDSKLVNPDDILENLESSFNIYSEECKKCSIGLDTIHASEEVDATKSSIKKNGLDDKNNGPDLALENELNYLQYCGIASSSKTPQSLEINLEDRLYSPSENLAASKVGHLFGKDLNSKVDTGVLINAMKTLSEVLVDHCLKTDARSTELYNDALKHIIGNLNSCLVKEADQVTQMETAVKSQQGTSSLEDALQSPTIRKVTAANIFSSRNEGLLDSSFSKDDAETVRDADTVKAIKSVLGMNFPSEELQQETVLYKNLWLEAEASLCATTVKSRFKRLKIEMEKRKHQGINDEAGTPVPEASNENEVAELSNEAKSSLNSTDMESSIAARSRTLRSVVEDLKPLNTEANHIASPSVTRQSNANNDVEASVMARLQILKSRADNLVSEPPSSNHSFQDSYISSIDSHKDDPEASVMSRFNILKSRHLDSLPKTTHQLPEPVDGPTLSSFISAQNRSLNVQCEGERVKDCLGASVSYNPGNDKFFEEWEYVLKEAFPRQK